MKVKSLSRIWLFVTPWTVVHQAPPSIEFSRQEYWSGLPFPSPRDLPGPGIVEINLTWVFCNLVAESNLPDTYFILSLRMNSIMLQSSVQFTGSVMSNSLWPHGLQHARPPCPSPTPGIYSNSCPLSRWCHPTISSSVFPFSSHLQSLPASGSFKWVGSLHQVAKVLELQLQHQSFQWIFRTDFL